MINNFGFNLKKMSRPVYAQHDTFIGRGLDAFGLKRKLHEEVRNRLKTNRDVSLLEIGCGKGNLLRDLANQYPDLRLSGVNKNKTHGIHNEKEFKDIASIYFADTTKLPFENSKFDIVISHVTFLHIRNKAKAIEEVYRVLKHGGIGLIGLGPYSIRHKKGHGMPQFYKNLRRTLGKNFNPRFLIQNNNTFIRISKFFERFDRDEIRLIQKGFTSKTQRGIAHWLVIHKKKPVLNLGLTFKSKESTELTQQWAEKNPVNWGVIDVYQCN